MTEPYKPISCSLHDEYEIAIMHKKYLSIRWLDENGETHLGNVLAKDIIVKDKQEFLIVAAQDNHDLCIRLDKITLLDN